METSTIEIEFRIGQTIDNLWEVDYKIYQSDSYKIRAMKVFDQFKEYPYYFLSKTDTVYVISDEVEWEYPSKKVQLSEENFHCYVKALFSEYYNEGMHFFTSNEFVFFIRKNGDDFLDALSVSLKQDPSYKNVSGDNCKLSFFIADRYRKMRFKEKGGLYFSAKETAYTTIKKGDRYYIQPTDKKEDVWQFIPNRTRDSIDYHTVDENLYELTREYNLRKICESFIAVLEKHGLKASLKELKAERIRSSKYDLMTTDAVDIQVLDIRRNQDELIDYSSYSTDKNYNCTFSVGNDRGKPTLFIMDYDHNDAITFGFEDEYKKIKEDYNVSQGYKISKDSVAKRNIEIATTQLLLKNSVNDPKSIKYPIIGDEWQFVRNHVLIFIDNDGFLNCGKVEDVNLMKELIRYGEKNKIENKTFIWHKNYKCLLTIETLPQRYFYPDLSKDFEKMNKMYPKEAFFIEEEPAYNDIIFNLPNSEYSFNDLRRNKDVFTLIKGSLGIKNQTKWVNQLSIDIPRLKSDKNIGYYKGIWFDVERLEYFVGDRNPYANYSQKKGNTMRRLSLISGNSISESMLTSAFKSLLEMLQVDFVRYRNDTVKPFPMYLLENIIDDVEVIVLS